MSSLTGVIGIVEGSASLNTKSVASKKLLSISKMIVLVFTASVSRNIIIKIGIVFSTTTLFAGGVTLAHVENTVPADLAVLDSGFLNFFIQVLYNFFIVID